MKLQWSSKAEDDLHRLHDFLVRANPQAANRIVQQLVKTAGTLIDHPRIGLRLPEFTKDEIRKIIVSDYEMRYLITDESITILRLWHTREDR